MEQKKLHELKYNFSFFDDFSQETKWGNFLNIWNNKQDKLFYKIVLRIMLFFPKAIKKN